MFLYAAPPSGGGGFPWQFADPSGPLQLLAIVQLGFWVIYAWLELRKPTESASGEK